MNNIFVTGATGFLGSLLIDEILSSSEDKIHILVRDRRDSLGKERMIATLLKLCGEGKFHETAKNRIYAHKGDITKKNLGLEGRDFKELIGKIDVIYHCAATTFLNLPLSKARRFNLMGAANLFDFALQCKEKGRLKKVNHVSTAYVAGNSQDIFKESNLDVGQRFNNTYEQSKYEAEKLVHEYRQKGLNVDIFRPSILLGRYADGRTQNFKMFYQPLHFFALEIFEKIPAMAHSKANIINIDVAARAIVLISRLTDKKNMTYHIVSPDCPTFECVLNVASDFFGFRKPELVKPEEIKMADEYSFVQGRMITPYVPYFSHLAKFDMENVEDCLKNTDFKFPKFDEANLMRLFEYCDRTGFIKRKINDAVIR